MLIKQYLKKLWFEFNRPMTKTESDNAHRWNMAQCGVKKCQCCGDYHSKFGGGESTGPK